MSATGVYDRDALGPLGAQLGHRRAHVGDGAGLAPLAALGLAEAAHVDRQRPVGGPAAPRARSP
jgi:hypothetical protein